MTIASAAARSDPTPAATGSNEVGVSENAGQQVVEVMCHAAGKHHQAFALLLFLDAPVESVALGLVAPPIGDVVNDHQPSGKPPLGVAHRRDFHFEVSRSRFDLDERRQSLAKRAVFVHRGVPPRHHFIDRTSQRCVGAAGVALGCGIEIDQAPLRIQHDHAVVHAVDHHVARHGHQAEQAISIHSPREARAGYGKRDRREVQAADRQRAGQIKKVRDPRHDRAGDDQRGLPAIGWRETAQPGTSVARASKIRM